VALGIVLAIGGFIMPSEYTTTEEECVEPAGEDACDWGGYERVEQQKESDFRAPIIVGGGILAVIGLVLSENDSSRRTADDFD